MKLLIMQSFSFRTLFSNTRSIPSSFNVKDQVPHHCKTTGKITVQRTLIEFLGSGREDKRF